MTTFYGETEQDYDLADFFVTQWSEEFAVAFHTESDGRYEYHGIAYQGDDLGEALKSLANGLGWYNVWK